MLPLFSRTVVLGNLKAFPRAQRDIRFHEKTYDKVCSIHFRSRPRKREEKADDCTGTGSIRIVMLDQDCPTPFQGGPLSDLGHR